MLKKAASLVSRDVYTLYAVIKNNRIPLAARIVALLTLGYVISPIDIIPDFIPFAGWVDDVLIIPLGMWAVTKLVPPEIMTEARQTAEKSMGKLKKIIYLGIALVILFWIAVLVLIYSLIKILS